MPQATWKPHEKHGRLTMQSDLPDSVYAFPELAKRVQIPGYEAVYELVHDAVSEGVLVPSISSGFYLQCEIWDVLKWANTELRRRQTMLSARIGGFSLDYFAMPNLAASSFGLLGVRRVGDQFQLRLSKFC